MRYEKLKILFLAILTVGSMLGVTACASLPFGEKTTAGEIEEEKENEEVNEEGLEEISELDFMKQAAEEVVNALCELTDDEIYIHSMTASDEVADLAAHWGDAAVDKTREIEIILLRDELLRNLLGEMDDFEQLSDTARDYIQTNIGKNITNMLNARAGANALATTAVLNYSKSYAVNFTVENQIWIIPTDQEGLEISVSFTHTGEGVITVNSSYLISMEGSSGSELLSQYLSISKNDTESIEW